MEGGPAACCWLVLPAGDERLRLKHRPLACLHSIAFPSSTLTHSHQSTLPPLPALQACAVGPPDDECCADQQRQLAELALQPQGEGPEPEPMATTPAPEPQPTWQQAPPPPRQPAPQQPQQAQQAQHPHARQLAVLLASQAQVSMPPAAQRALQALLPTNLLPGGADAGSQLSGQLSGQLAAANLECLPSPSLLTHLMAGEL